MVKSAICVFIVCFLLSAGFQSCSRSVAISNLEPKPFLEKLKQDSTSVLLDVRTPEEFNEGHLAGSLNYNVNGGDFESQVSKIDTSQAVYVYCRSGKRSVTAGEILAKKGYRKIYNMLGGIKQWTAEGLPVTKDKN